MYLFARLISLSEALAMHLRSLNKKQCQRRHHTSRFILSQEEREVSELLIRQARASERMLPQHCSLDSLRSALLEVGASVVPCGMDELVNQGMGINGDVVKSSASHTLHPSTRGYFMCRENEVGSYFIFPCWHYTLYFSTACTPVTQCSLGRSSGETQIVTSATA